MNKLLLIPILLGIAVVVSVSLLLISESSLQSTSKPTYELDFTYYDIETIQTSLEKQNIFMSTPVAITDNTISQYCAFFDDENIQKSVEYCTTSALLDSDGVTFGNINMGGTTDGPIMALAIIDASPFLDSKKNEVTIVFQTLIEALVCDCWEKKQPGDFESVSVWLNIAEEKYAESEPSQTTLKSKITGLDNKKLILEITSKDESYLWTLIVLK